MMVRSVSSSPPAWRTRRMTGEGIPGARWQHWLPRAFPDGRRHSWLLPRASVPGWVSLGKPVTAVEVHCYPRPHGRNQLLRDISKAINHYKIRPHQVSSWSCMKQDKEALAMFTEYCVSLGLMASGGLAPIPSQNPEKGGSTHSKRRKPGAQGGHGVILPCLPVRHQPGRRRVGG